VALVVIVWWIVAAALLVWRSPLRPSTTWDAATATAVTLGIAATVGWLWHVRRPGFRQRRFQAWQWISALALPAAILTTPPFSIYTHPATTAYDVGALWYQITAFAGIVIVYTDMLRREPPLLEPNHMGVLKQGHVLARLNGYGVQLVPHWPYRFVRPVEDDPATVCVVRTTPDGDRTATISAENPHSVDGVVDVTTEPSPDGWRIETTRFSVPWPDGFDVTSPTDGSDRTYFYLTRADDAKIFPQGPVRTDRLPAPEAWAADGQRIASRDVVDGIEIIELAYEIDGAGWWQSHWVVPWTAGRSLIFTAQAPNAAVEPTRRAARQVASGVQPTRRRPIASDSQSPR
jgi:hypothetical protein